MTRLIPRLALIATCAAALCGLVAAPAGAAVLPPTVSAATHVTPGSAVLNGVVNTGGLPASYSFEYDTVKDWNAGGDNASFTPVVFIPAGASSVPAVGVAGCFPTALCAPDATPLSAGQKYEVILYVTFNTGSSAYYYNLPGNSSEGLFSTPKAGSLNLLGQTLKVVKGKTSVSFKCASTQSCEGKLTITAKKKKKTLTCASAKVAIKAGKKSSVKVKVSGPCLALAAKSASLSVAGKLTVITTTGQPNVKKTVVISLKK